MSSWRARSAAPAECSGPRGALEQAIRYLVILQGLVIAPLVIWASPIVELLLGPGYRHADEIMRWIAPYYFLGAPAALITVAVTYLGEARRRIAIMVVTFVLGVLATWVLLRAIGVIGAAIADDVIEIVYVAGHLWICARLISLDWRRLGRSGLSTLAAASAMALVLFGVGTDHLSAAQWILGAGAGTLVYAAVLLGTRELTIDELRGAPRAVRAGLRR